MIFLDSEKIQDSHARENLEKVSEFINSNPLTIGEFKVFDIDVTNITSTVKLRHNLSFKPTDIWVSWVTNSSTVVVKYDEVDEEFLAFTATAICKLRLLVGRID